MAITKTNQPYEFLARWNNGALAGAHIRFLETISEDGVVLSQKEGNAQPVSLAGEAGFPIEDILTSLQATAITERDAAVAAKATAEAALATANTEHTAAMASAQATHTAELAAKDAEIARLTALIPAPVIVSGVPQTVTMRQARLALLASGLLDDVTAAVAGAGEAAKIEWEYASDVSRNAMLIQTLGGALGLTDEQLDGLFVLAATL